MTYKELLEDNSPGNKVLRFDKVGHTGMGIVLRHFGGDGVFPVVSRYNADGDLIEVAIIFGDYDDEDSKIMKESFECDCFVDSGQLMIADPCYVLPREPRPIGYECLMRETDPYFLSKNKGNIGMGCLPIGEDEIK